MRRTLGKGLVAALLVSLVAATGAVPGQAAPASGESGLETLGRQGWQVQSTAQAAQPGGEVSKPGFDTKGWLKVRPDDGGAPGTEIEALLQNGKCPDVYFSDNMRKCFGYTTNNAGPVTIPPFDVPWWFRTDFTPDGNGDTRQLVVNGVIGKADVWVNGQQVAANSTVTGAYTKFTFDVSKLVAKGRNTVALELYPNDPGKMFTVSDIDWNQVPPDNNTGIHFPVQLKVSGALNNGNARVLQDNAKDLSRSTLTPKTDVTKEKASSRAKRLTPAQLHELSRLLELYVTAHPDDGSKGVEQLAHELARSTK